MRRGFTLVELLCVIVIIAIISLITFPKVTNYIKKTREDLYKTQVKDLKKSGEKWALDNIEYLDKYHINDIYITLDLLKNFKYLEKDIILSPKDKSEMNGCILISYKDNKYTYDYKEINCTDPNTDLSEYSDSYIVYDSAEQGDDYIISKSENSNEHSSAYLDILNNNDPIRILGETQDGLYELDDEYVFRGNTVNNYVTYSGKTWRILSINKTDYSMKLINISSSPTSNIGDTLSEISTSNYPKLLDKWNNGIIDNVNSSITELRNAISQKTDTAKIGLISLYDYAIASLDDNCNNNISTGSCANKNYLATIFNGESFWTMNQNTDGKYWYVKSDNSIGLAEASDGPYRYAVVIQVPINVYCENAIDATGSDEPFAYKLK